MLLQNPASTITAEALLARTGEQRLLLFPRAAPDLPAQILSAGISRERSSRYNWQGLSRGRDDFVLFQYTLSGSGRLRYETGHYTATAGTAMLLHFPHDHHYWLDEGAEWCFFFVCLQGPKLVPIWREALHTLGPLPAWGMENDCVRYFAQLCLTVLDSSWTEPWHPSALAWAAAMMLAQQAQTTAGAPEHQPQPSAITAACELVQRAYAQAIGVADMARCAGLSRYHFSRLFRDCTGLSPAAYLNRTRLRRAVDLLHNPRLSIKTIARRCGFAEANYFCRRFRAYYGISPGAYRKRGLISTDQQEDPA